MTRGGAIDVTYLNPEGLPTLVETTLWRNPEARRVAVAQILDYACEVSRWSYEDFVTAARKVLSASSHADPLADAVRKHEEDFDEARVADAVKRNLERGRFLLLIVGDGIHEGLEQLATTLSRWRQLGFTLALVELALFRAAQPGRIPAERHAPQILPDRRGRLRAGRARPRRIAETRETLRASGQTKGTQMKQAMRPKNPDDCCEVCGASADQSHATAAVEAQSPILRETLTAFEEQTACR